MIHRLWNLWLDYAMDELSAYGIDISVLATANRSHQRPSHTQIPGWTGLDVRRTRARVG